MSVSCLTAHSSTCTSCSIVSTSASAISGCCAGGVSVLGSHFIKAHKPIAMLKAPKTSITTVLKIIHSNHMSVALPSSDVASAPIIVHSAITAAMLNFLNPPDTLLTCFCTFILASTPSHCSQPTSWLHSSTIPIKNIRASILAIPSALASMSAGLISVSIGPSSVCRDCTFSHTHNMPQSRRRTLSIPCRLQELRRNLTSTIWATSSSKNSAICFMKKASEAPTIAVNAF